MQFPLLQRLSPGGAPPGGTSNSGQTPDFSHTHDEP